MASKVTRCFYQVLWAQLLFFLFKNDAEPVDIFSAESFDADLWLSRSCSNSAHTPPTVNFLCTSRTLWISPAATICEPPIHSLLSPSPLPASFRVIHAQTSSEPTLVSRPQPQPHSPIPTHATALLRVTPLRPIGSTPSWPHRLDQGRRPVSIFCLNQFATNSLSVPAVIGYIQATWWEGGEGGVLGLLSLVTATTIYNWSAGKTRLCDHLMDAYL